MKEMRFKSWWEAVEDSNEGDRFCNRYNKEQAILEIEESIITLENSFSITDESEWERIQTEIDKLNEELIIFNR